jgi:pre-mRNA-processing factor 19
MIFKAYGAEAPERLEQVIEEAGMSDEVLQKLQDKATRLTAERKKRGKTVPDGLVTVEDIKSYRQQSSRVVSTV